MDTADETVEATTQAASTISPAAGHAGIRRTRSAIAEQAAVESRR
jgi:hypothetical protein